MKKRLSVHDTVLVAFLNKNHETMSLGEMLTVLEKEYDSATGVPLSTAHISNFCRKKLGLRKVEIYEKPTYKGRNHIICNRQKLAAAQTGIKDEVPYEQPDETTHKTGLRFTIGKPLMGVGVHDSVLESIEPTKSKYRGKTAWRWRFSNDSAAIELVTGSDCYLGTLFGDLVSLVCDANIDDDVDITAAMGKHFKIKVERSGVGNRITTVIGNNKSVVFGGN
jgi:hypothetical protein